MDVEGVRQRQGHVDRAVHRRPRRPLLGLMGGRGRDRLLCCRRGGGRCATGQRGSGCDDERGPRRGHSWKVPPMEPIRVLVHTTPWFWLATSTVIAVADRSSGPGGDTAILSWRGHTIGRDTLTAVIRRVDLTQAMRSWRARSTPCRWPRCAGHRPDDRGGVRLIRPSGGYASATAQPPRSTDQALVVDDSDVGRVGASAGSSSTVSLSSVGTISPPSVGSGARFRYSASGSSDF